MLTIYKQGDRRWKDKFLGKSKCTIGAYGCTSVDVTIAYNWMFNKRLTPDQVVSKLDYTDKKRYPSTEEGLLLWNSLKILNMKLVKRVYGKKEAEINKALAHPTQVCLIQVNYNHWVFLIGKKTTKGYRVIDPYYGDICHLNRYKNNITGCAILDKL